MALSRTRLVHLALFLLIVATAAGARVGFLMTYADSGAAPSPIQVQADSDLLDVQPSDGGRPSDQETLIANIREHHWFGSLSPLSGDQEEQTAHVAPGYPWLVGELARLLDRFELGPLDSTVRWIQCILGALTAGLYFLFAHRAFGNLAVAILAGAFCALHPFWITNTAEISDGVLVSFLLGLSLYLGARIGKQVEALPTLFYGLVLAGLALVRAALLPFAFVALLWYLWRCRSLASGWMGAMLATLGFILALTPWTLRNHQVYGKVFPVVDSTYYHLWMGNNPNATGGPMTEHDLLKSYVRYVDEKKMDWREEEKRFHAAPQPERYGLLAKPFIHEIKAQPVETMSRRIWAGLYFFFGEDWFTKNQLWQSDTGGSTAAEDSVYPCLLTTTLLCMLLLGVLGWRWTYAWRHESMPSSLAIFWIPLPYLLSHAEALSGPRLPLDGVLLTYAAFALACMIPGSGYQLLSGPKETEED